MRMLQFFRLHIRAFTGGATCLTTTAEILELQTGGVWQWLSVRNICEIAVFYCLKLCVLVFVAWTVKMPKWCSAGTCKNHHLMPDEKGKTKLSFLKFPSHEKEPDRRRLRAGACARMDAASKPWKPNANARNVYIGLYLLCSFQLR